MRISATPGVVQRRIVAVIPRRFDSVMTPPSTPARVAIARLSKQQHGVFTRAQAIDAGLHPRAIDRRLRAGQWERVDHAVYRVAGTPPGWRQSLKAACLVGPAVASHRSAAAMLGFVDCEEHVVEVTAWRHRRRHRGDVVWHESYRLDASDVTEVDEIPVTRPRRTLLDLGVLFDLDRLEELLDDGLRRGWFSLESVSRRWEELGGLLRPGGRAIRSVLDRKESGQRPPASILETRFRQLVRRAGLPEPVAQYEVHDGDTLIARVDFAYPELGLVIEVDGEERHASRSSRKHDARRERRLVGLGFRVLRFHWDDIHKYPDDVLRDIAALIMRSA
jgi:Protein of unknown function (DUF559)/Transcriptional regulator, AbiEi antitoxin